jgi:hypothetical protein
MWFPQVSRARFIKASLLVAIVLFFRPGVASAQTEPPKKLTWKSVEFAIIRFNDQAPNSWNIYHGEKKGIVLVRLWKRYMLVRVNDEEVYDLDPQKISVHGDSVEWSPADIPDKPIETTEWKARNVGSMERIRFRFGKTGHYLELQLPLAINGDPMY